jgi:hypothetical protein
MRPLGSFGDFKEKIVWQTLNQKKPLPCFIFTKDRMQPVVG